MQGWGFHPRNLVDFTLKSGGFQPWNLVDFTQISSMKSTQNYKSKCFSKNSSVWWMQGGGYDQGFHEIHQISPWNLVDFTCQIQQSSPRFHLWNPPKIIKASVSAKTLQFDECRVGAMTKDSWNPPDFTLKSGGFHLSNLAEFTQISSMKSTQNYKSKCFSKNSSVWWMQGGGYDQGFHEICWISHEIHMKSTRFHADFMKSGGFHVKSKDLLQGIVIVIVIVIVTLCFLGYRKSDLIGALLISRWQLIRLMLETNYKPIQINHQTISLK